MKPDVTPNTVLSIFPYLVCNNSKLSILIWHKPEFASPIKWANYSLFQTRIEIPARCKRRELVNLKLIRPCSWFAKSWFSIMFGWTVCVRIQLIQFNLKHLRLDIFELVLTDFKHYSGNINMSISGIHSSENICQLSYGGNTPFKWPQFLHIPIMSRMFSLQRIFPTTFCSIYFAT